MIKNSAMFEECREVVSNVDEFYANCVYDSCRSASYRLIELEAGHSTECITYTGHSIALLHFVTL